MDPLFAELPEDISTLSDEDLESYIATSEETAAAVANKTEEYLGEGRDFAALKEELTEGIARIKAAKEELRGRPTKKPVDSDADDADNGDNAAQQEELAALVAEAFEVEEEAEPEAEPAPAEAPAEAEPEAEPEAPAEEVTASAKPKRPSTATVSLGGTRKRLGRPARSQAAEPQVEETRVELTAAAEGLGFGLGQTIPDTMSIAEMMVKRRKQFGHSIPEGTHGDQIPIVRADWSHLYPPERILSTEDADANYERVTAVTASAEIDQNFRARRNSEPDALTASGGLCAPVTPYYNLQMISQANRPVRAALPAFNADRGGIRYARPAALSAITTAVGLKTAAEDAAGGSEATKTCQVVDCPPFQETDVEIIYHCLQFGNLGARTFPERVAQWNALVLAAHARTAETVLLDGIDAASTQVTATDLGIGASANILNEALAAGNAMRSRHRMDPAAVLRAMFPIWILDLLVADVYRSQFERFDMGPDDFVALLRAGNIEPTFYIDSATGKGQVFGTQAAGALLSFPANAVWYLFPEGSFLYVDGGILELGLVRDSVLNKTNDFQIFGESFENVAFVGVESLAITSAVCDSGAVSLPIAVTECGDYGVS